MNDNPKPQSPYKLAQTRNREICFDASTQDFQDFKFRFSTFASVDAICATLFYHFMQAAKSQLPLAESTEIEASNNERFNKMISNLNIQF